jgi:hypothetical protein
MKHRILIIVYLRKVHLKKFGIYVLRLMREEDQSQKKFNGIVNFKK